ncbi:MAG: hypothetical protein V2I65_07000 [Paracoccaceae bacterium]|nr:hypothetical protein [Paracoccaceae bacterium]
MIPASSRLRSALVAVATLSVVPGAAISDTVLSPSDWSQALVVELLLDTTPGVPVAFSLADNPLVIFGFNPQPEPPALGRVNDLGRIDPEVSITLESPAFDSASGFELLVGIVNPGGDATLVAPAGIPTGPFSRLTYAADIGTTTLSLDFGFETSSGGQALGAVSFNPQPEPPPFLDPDATGGLGFGFTSFSSATVTLTVRDPGGNAVPVGNVTTVAALAPIPLPVTAPLLAGGFGILLLLRRRAA